MIEKLSARFHVRHPEKPLILFLLIIPSVMIPLRLNNDVWFLLNSGRYVLEKGIPHTEPFTLHEGMAFVMQQWLTAVLFWAVYSAFGPVGLLTVVAGTFAGIILIIYKLCLRISEDNFLISFLVTLFASFLTSLFMQTRPYVFSTLILVLELFLLESFIGKNNPRYLLFLPVLSALLINLHAAMWPMMFILFIPYLIDSFPFHLGFLNGQGYRKGFLFASAGLSLAAGFANPYGLDAMTYLYRSYGDSDIFQLVAEMRPPNINDALGKIIIGAIFIVFLVRYFNRGGEPRLRYTLLELGLAYMTMSSVRSFLYFMTCAVFTCAYYLRKWTPPAGKFIKTEKSTLKLRKILAGLLILAFTATLFLKYQTLLKTREEPDEAGAVRYIRSHAAAGTPVYTAYDEGGYAEFMGLRAYLDPRAEVFLTKNNHQADYIGEFCKLQTGELDYRSFLDKYSFAYVLVSKGDILHTYIPSDADYTLVYEDKHYRVYGKT